MTKILFTAVSSGDAGTPNEVPEPTSMVLGSGLVTLAEGLRKRFKI